MRLSITIKWILTLLLSSLIGVALVGFFAYWTTTREFDRFRSELTEQDFIEDVIQYYETNNSWDGVSEHLYWSIEPANHLDTASNNFDNSREEANTPGNFNTGRDGYRFAPIIYALVDVDGTVLSGAGPIKVGDTIPLDEIEPLVPITLDGVTIGYAVNALPPQGLSPDEREYLNNTNRALIAGVIGASSVAVLVGLLLSRHFLYPLTELTEAITAMKSGELHQQVTVKTNDELGQLAETFNQMSEEIHRANQLRQQMTADIAHDLRTPLQVITGYIEAMRDGVLPATPERFDAMNNEALLLKRLVDDLRTLSLADAKQLKLVYEDVAPHELIDQVKDTFASLAAEQSVSITVESDDDLPELKLDRSRMIQVLSNLVSNALRYTPEGGVISLRTAQADDTIQLIVSDTGSGIPAAKLANIFERFYRVDESRHEVEGESGLGLAIVKSIVQAHEGTVTATSVVGEGTTFTITLPV